MEKGPVFLCNPCACCRYLLLCGCRLPGRMLYKNMATATPEMMM